MELQRRHSSMSCEFPTIDGPKTGPISKSDFTSLALALKYGVTSVAHQQREFGREGNVRHDRAPVPRAALPGTCASTEQRKQSGDEDGHGHKRQRRAALDGEHAGSGTRQRIKQCGDRFNNRPRFISPKQIARQKALNQESTSDTLPAPCRISSLTMSAAQIITMGC